MKQAIDAAIASHLAWVADFRRALDHDAPDDLARLAGYDDMCEFGRWLYAQPDAIKHDPRYGQVKDLHYRFHVEASRIAFLAQEGQRLTALAELESVLAELSAKLISALEHWQRSRAPGVGGTP